MKQWRPVLSFLGLALVAGPALALPGNTFELTKLAPGVYAAIRHVEAGSSDGNVMFIINDSDVVVVDTGHYSTDADEMIRAIRKLTDKPVRCVVNTHFHIDHTSGNEAYVRAFPGVEIVAHPETRSEMMRGGTLESTIPDFQSEIDRIGKALDTGKDSEGKAVTAERRRHLELARANFEFWIRDARRTHRVMPTLTVADRLVLHRGDRDIEIRFLGKGHTAGDLVVYLPKERIVATGDLVVHPVPFGGSEYLKDWAATLRELEKLDAATLVPGHGEIQHGWEYVDRQIALFESTWEQVRKAVEGGTDLEATRKAVDGNALSAGFGATSATDREEFDYEFLDPAIDVSYKVLRPDGGARQ